MIILFLLFASSAPMNLAGDGPETFNLQHVVDGIYVHQGVHVPFDHPQGDDIANIGFIIGDKCIAIIDTGGSVDIGQKLLTSIRAISQLPICYVINTHVHFDHILGNAAFLNETTQFVGHNQLGHAIEQSRDFFLQRFAAYLGDAPKEESIIAPQLTVNDSIELDLGNRIIRLTAYPIAHSYTDLTVFDSRSKTLWAGDLIFRERVPVIDGKLKDWLKVLQEIETLQVQILIPGHGSISKVWSQAYAAQQGYLEMLLSETREAIATGSLLEEAMDSIGRQDQRQWLLYDQHHKGNVTKAFTELEWE